MFRLTVMNFIASFAGNAAQFQGDERDVVFISLVDTAERGALSLRDQELFK
jgi:superfamily I DNA and/or RNA helicase